MTWTTPVKRIESYKELLAKVNELQPSKEVLVIIGGGMLQYAAFIETANMNLAVLLVDGDEYCYCRFLCNHFVKVSIKEPFKVITKVKEYFINHPELKPIGVYTQGCDVEFTVAVLAQYLGLPGITPQAAKACNNKIETRINFARSYIPQPVFVFSEDLQVLKGEIKLLKDMGFPCVIKAVDNCASRGLTIINNETQTEDAFYLAQANSVDQRVIAEQFIAGQEYSVDTIIYKNRLYPAGISDREFDKSEGFALQTGSLTPSLLPAETQAEIYRIMLQASWALGVDMGAFKGDIIIDKNGKIFVLEVTARLSGGFDAQYRKPLSFGVNLIKATIDLALGRDLDFYDLIPKWVKYSKTFHIFPKPGKIIDIQGIDELGHIKGVSGIRKIFWAKNIGDTIGDYKNCADRVIHIIGYADTLEQLREVEKNAQNTLKVITEVRPY